MLDVDPEKIANHYLNVLRFRRDNLFPSRIIYPNFEIINSGVYLCRNLSAMSDLPASVYGEAMTFRALKSLLPEPPKFIDSLPLLVQSFLGKGEILSLTVAEQRCRLLEYAILQRDGFKVGNCGELFKDWLIEVREAGIYTADFLLEPCLDGITPRSLVRHLRDDLLSLQYKTPTISASQSEIFIKSTVARYGKISRFGKF